MAVRDGWVERFHDDELIVPIPQLGVVRTALRDCGVQVGDRGVEENGVLGLARLFKLAQVDDGARWLEERPGIGPRVRKYRGERNAAHAGHGVEPVSDLAVLIHGLKLQLAQTYPGWQISIGKNYAPSLVRGNPHTDANGQPSSTDGPPTGPIVQPDPHTDVQPDPHTDDQRQPGRPVRVGLIDTRLFPHESLTNRYVGRADDILSPDLPVFTEFDGHCTFVASCILRQAPGAMLYLRHVLDEHGDGTVWAAAAGIADLVTEDLDVVNLSFGQYMTDDDSAPMVLDAAIRQFSRDTVVVAAAGNNGNVDADPPAGVPRGVKQDTASYPAALPDVVGVGAVDAENQRAPFTPKNARWITLLARGVDVNAAYLRGEVRLGDRDKPTEFSGVANWAGCSFAAGVVTGVIAARTVPGQRSARQALGELVGSLGQKPWPGLLLNLDGR